MAIQANLWAVDAPTSNWVLKKDFVWQKHGWWLKFNDNGISKLRITFYPLMPNHTICGLEKESNTMVQLFVSNLTSTHWLYITSQIESASTSKYMLDRWLIVLLVPENLVKKPKHKIKGFAILAKLLMELSYELKEQRKMVIQWASKLLSWRHS